MVAGTPPHSRPFTVLAYLAVLLTLGLMQYGEGGGSLSVWAVTALWWAFSGDLLPLIGRRGGALLSVGSCVVASVTYWCWQAMPWVNFGIYRGGNMIGVEFFASFAAAILFVLALAQNQSEMAMMSREMGRQVAELQTARIRALLDAYSAAVVSATKNAERVSEWLRCLTRIYAATARGINLVLTKEFGLAHDDARLAQPSIEELIRIYSYDAVQVELEDEPVLVRYFPEEYRNGGADMPPDELPAAYYVYEVRHLWALRVQCIQCWSAAYELDTVERDGVSSANPWRPLADAFVAIIEPLELHFRRIESHLRSIIASRPKGPIDNELELQFFLAGALGAIRALRECQGADDPRPVSPPGTPPVVGNALRWLPRTAASSG